MSPLACATEELGWFRQLGQRAAVLAKRANACELGETNSASPREWQSFDLADVMEQGFAQTLTTSFITPASKELPARNLTVQRSKDRSRYVVCGEDGDELLFARRSADACQFDIYVPAGGDPPMAVGAAFTMTADRPSEQASSKSSTQVVAMDWTLTSERCTECQYVPHARLGCCPQASCKQEVAKIRQEKVEIGPAAIMCMEVDLPAILEDGTPEVHCTRKASLGKPRQSIQLVSRRPEWNRRIKNLTLSFHGRCGNPSTQNIQLDVKDTRSADHEELPDFLFGSVGENQFVLDYKYPLGLAQAFAMALSTESWDV